MRRVRLITFVGVFALAVGALGGVAGADDAAEKPAGEPERDPAALREANWDRCTLLPTDSPDSEWYSCLRVDATLDRAPSVGETATLTVAVLAAVDIDAVTVTVDVPEAFEVVSGDGTGRAAGVSPRGDGSLVVPQVLEEALAAGETGVSTFTVRALEAGPHAFEVRAIAPLAPGFSDGAMDVAYVTVGGDGHTASLSIGDDYDPVPVLVEDAGPVPEPDPDWEAAPPDDAELFGDDPTGPTARATSCVSGRFGYTPPGGGYVGAPNLSVNVWDHDTFSADDKIASGVTNSTGNYNLCWTEEDGEGDANQEVYIRIHSSNSVWRVEKQNGDEYRYRLPGSGTIDMPPGASHSFGSVEPTNTDRGIHAFHAVDKFWQWGNDPAPGGLCFDWGDAPPCNRKLTVIWYIGSSDGTYYSHSDKKVHLAEADPDSEHTTIHEATHAAMYDVYNDGSIAGAGGPHFVQGDSNTGMSWTEGFAEWVPAAVLNDPFYRWANGNSLDLENVTWDPANFDENNCTNVSCPTWFNWDEGAEVEGRVAGAMIDIDDSAVAAQDYWDYWSESEYDMYEVFQDWNTLGNGAYPQTYAAYWTDRGQAGYNTTDGGANAANYQNSIDFDTFRDPLTPYVQRTRPTPDPNDHNYRIQQDWIYWSVVAARPPGGADYDLSLYDDEGQSTWVQASAYGGSTIDFIAIDGNHRTLQVDYPRVYQWNGTGEYQVEYAAGNSSLSGTAGIYMGTTDVVAVRDSYQTSGITYYYRAVPAAGQDIELALMQSTAGNSSTYVRSRGAAVRLGSGGGASSAESFNYSSPTSDWLGVVLLNKSGSGTVTLYRDSNAPIGSVSIEGGAADTDTTSVSLDLSATDSQTGVWQMRVAADGVLDSEPWEPYSTVKNVSLPAGDGVKTVAVQFKNNAGMTSSVYTDTILLYTGLRCRGLVPTHKGNGGDNTIIGTTGDDVILAYGGDDTIYGKDGDDVICAGTGHDLVYGGPGNDRLFGYSGADEMYGGSGGDWLYGMAGGDDLFGQNGADRMSGGPGLGDSCDGGAGTHDTDAGGCESTVGIP